MHSVMVSCFDSRVNVTTIGMCSIIIVIIDIIMTVIIVITIRLIAMATYLVCPHVQNIFGALNNNKKAHVNVFRAASRRATNGFRFEVMIAGRPSVNERTVLVVLGNRCFY